MQAAVGAWGLGLLVGIRALGVHGAEGSLGRALMASVGVAVHVSVAGPSDGVCVWGSPSVGLAGCRAAGAPG